MQQITDKLMQKATMQEELLAVREQAVDREELSELYLAQIKAKLALVQQNAEERKPLRAKGGSHHSQLARPRKKMADYQMIRLK